MDCLDLGQRRVSTYSQTEERYLNPSDIYVPAGYKIEVLADGLNFPVNMVFSEYGDIFVGESGYLQENPRVLLINDRGRTVIADGFNPPLTGVNYYNGNLYVSHKGHITVIYTNGSRRNIISGLPSNGDFTNNKVEFGSDGKFYFGQGAVTNSGVVGPDNRWVNQYALLHDYPGDYIMLNGQNFVTNNMLLDADVEEQVLTGAFSPYSVANSPHEIRKGIAKATASILRANLNGTELETYAWGIRNAVRLKFDQSGRLFAANQGFDVRGSRPIANATDHIYQITQGLWYGWPDYTAGEPVTTARFMAEGKPPTEFLLSNPPNVPPTPFALFPTDSNIMGFDINYHNSFGSISDIYVAEFGSVGHPAEGYQPNPGVGHRVSRTNLFTGGTVTFAMNRSGFVASNSGEGGFGWLTDAVFGQDHALYILDFGTNPPGELSQFLPNTGVIWKISREG